MAITATTRFRTIAGDKIFECHRLYGDGSTTTYTCPVAEVESAWFQRIDDTETDEMLSYSGAVVTFGAAVANGKYTDLFFVGI